MFRTFLAFLAFNAYSGCIVWAFQINTAYRFDSEMIRRLSGTGIDSPNHWGWGNHYIWRLVALIAASVFAGVLAGAIQRSRGGLTAAASNVPSIAICVFLAYTLITDDSSFVYGDQTIRIHTGMIVTSLIAIPMTTWLAYQSGNLGAKIQHDSFSTHSVLGIAGYHWAWMIVPIYMYASGAILPISSFFSFNFLQSVEGILPAIISCLLLATALASLFPLWWVYRRLMTPAVTITASFSRAIINFVVLIVGIAAVAGVQLLNSWLLGKIALFSR